MKYPRVLVVSNNSFSQSSNNGRILGNFFIGWHHDKIAQFCISTTEPDFSICTNYYMVTDKAVLQSFFKLQKAPRCKIENELLSEGNTQLIRNHVQKKNILKSLIRNIIWGNKRWVSPQFDKWIDDFSPDVVLVYNSDSYFIHKIGLYIAEKKSIPLVMYNTEGYYFFQKNYLGFDSYNVSFSLYQHLYKKWFRRFMKSVSLSIHLNDKLANDFSKEFGGRHEVLRGVSTIRENRLTTIPINPKFSYLGNFSYNRVYPLIEISNILNKIDNRFKLTVYGKLPSEDVMNLIMKSENIVYGGLVPYDKVVEVMLESTILFHAEDQGEKYEEAIRYGFSSKIPDSIASGRPFIIYSSSHIAGADYIKNTGAGWCVTSADELEQAIKEVLFNDDARNKVLDKAHEIASINHRSEVLNKEFHTFINSLTL